jgi:hypothetical protein
MKKAKIILSAVAVFAVIGGAFAVKATRFVPQPYFTSYQTTTTVNGPLVTRCAPSPTLSITADLAAPLSTVYSTTLAGNICSRSTFTHVTTINE